MRKKLIILILCLAALFLLTGCRIRNIHIPRGYVSSEEHREIYGFQDYTDYCIYRYPSEEAVKGCAGYSPVTEDDIDRIAGYFNDFEAWMEMENRLDEYHFDPSVISVGDLCYIHTKEGQPIGSSFYGTYDDYTVCFFDTDTFTLYYIHNNI